MSRRERAIAIVIGRLRRSLATPGMRVPILIDLAREHYTEDEAVHVIGAVDRALERIEQCETPVSVRMPPSR